MGNTYIKVCFVLSPLLIAGLPELLISDQLLITMSGLKRKVIIDFYAGKVILILIQ